MVTDPKKNLVDGKYTIRDLVDLKQLRGIFQHFTDTMGFTIGFLSVPDMEILVATGWRDICTKFHRRCPVSRENCLKSNARLIRHMNKPGKVVVEACANGLVDCAMPIFIKGKCVAILATGQVLLEAPDLSRFRRQAKAFGCNEKKYMSALAEIPVTSAKRLKQVTGFLKELASLVAELGYAHLKEKEKSEQLAWDIGERKRSGVVLKETVGQLRALYDAVTDGFVVADIETRKIVKTNSSACRMFGYSEREFLCRKVSDLHQKVHRDTVLSQFREVAQGKKRFVADLPCLKKDGAIFFADITAQRLVFQGKWCLAGFFRDITERKLAEEALRESEEKYRVLAEKSPNMIFINQRGRVVYANPKCEKVMGYRRREFYAPKFNFLRLMHPAELPQVRHNFLKHQKGKEVAPYEYRMITKRGKVIYGILTSKLIHYRGTPAILGIVTDITERKRAEEELKRLFSLQRATLESTADGILVVDHGTRKIADFNRRFSQLWNIPSRILQSRDDKQLLKYVLPQLKDPRKFFLKVTDLYRDPLKESFDVLEFKDGRIFERYSHPQLVNHKPVGRVWSFRDVTERSKAEESLKESKTQLDLALNSACMGVWRFDIVKNKRYFDKQVCRLLGIDPETFSGKAEEFFRVVHPDDRKVIKAALAQTIGKGVPYEPEYRVVWPDKSVHHVTVRGKLARDREGRPWRLNGVIWDITERKLAEEELRKSEARFRSYFNLPLHGIAITSNKKEWIQVNDRVCSILGYSRGELLRKTWSEMTHPDDLAVDVKQFRRIFSGEIEQYAMDKRFIRKDGKIIWVSLAVGCVRKSNGKVDYICALLEDITDRKQAENSLREHRRQLLQIIDAVPHMVFVKDKEGRFLIANRAVGMMYDKEPQQLIGKKREDVHSVREEVEKFAETDRRVLATGTPVLVADEIFTDVMGRKHVLQTVKIPFKMAGLKEETILGVSVDVTEQKRVEEFRNDIVRMVSHELRTPLSIQKEGVSLVLDGSLGPLSPKQEMVLKTVMRSVNRLARMIGGLLDISRIESGKLELRKEKTVLEDLLKDVVFEFRKKFEEKGLELKVRLPETSTEVWVDPDKITQVVTNLVENAFKFTEQGVVEISLTVLKNEVEYRVRDTGIGIASENVGKIFEKFQQFSRTAGPGERGLGLGLAIAKEIISLHGGRIWAQSELGKGTQVTFTLPLSPKKTV